jgi:acyl carrier protein
MLDREAVNGIIYGALENLNQELADDQKIEKSLSTVLFGLDAKIDSLSLVSVVVDIETELNSGHDLEVSLTDDRAMTREISPFSTVGTLSDYIMELVGERQA